MKRSKFDLKNTQKYSKAEPKQSTRKSIMKI